MTTTLSNLMIGVNLITQNLTSAPTPAQYQLSFGDQIHPKPPVNLSPRQAWEAVETAKDVWETSVERYIDDIQQYHHQEIFKGLSPHPPISRRCWMIGASRDFAHPTAVIACERERVLKRLVRLISRNQLFRATDFRIITIISSLAILHGTAHLQVNPNAWTNTLSLLGAEIYSTHLNRRATLGGVILVNNKLYGLTVAHICAGEEFPQASNGRSQGKATFYDELDFEVTEFDSDSDSGSISDYDDTQHQELSGTDGSAPDYCDASNIGTESFRVYVPTGFLSSTHPLKPGFENEYDECDWALSTLEIDCPKVNEVSFPSTSEQSQQHLYVKRVIPNDLLNPEDASNRNRETIQLWVVTRRGPIKAYSKAGSSTSVSFFNSHTFQKFWTIQLSEILKPGDSGSWVIDANTGDLYGVLIAQSELLNEGYVIQAIDILQDIRVKLGTNTQLPTADDALSEAIKYGDISLMERLINVVVEQKSLSDNTATIALGALVAKLPLSSWDEYLPLFILLRNNGADTSDGDVLRAVSGVLAEFENDSKAARDHEKPPFLEAILFLLIHSKYHPLFWAVYQGHQRIAQLLFARSDIEVQVQVGLKDREGRTLLSIAAEKGQEQVVHLLLKYNSVDVESKDNNGRTPLSWAAGQGQETLVHLLLRNSSVDVESKDNNGRTPLSWAAGQGQETLVYLLLGNSSVDVESKDNNGRTPLSWAAGQGQETLVRQLLEHNAQFDAEDNDGRTPLSWAATGYDGEAVMRLLLERQVRVDVEDNNGRTPLSRAAENGQETVVRLLLERDGIKVDSQDEYGRTALSYAAEKGQETVVRLLLEHDGIEVDLQDEYGRTALSYAAENGQETVVRLLIERDGIKVDLQDEYGRTALSYAAGKGRKLVVLVLLEHKDINVNSKDKDGKTPLWWAKREPGYMAGIRVFGSQFRGSRWYRYKSTVVDMIKAHGGKVYGTEEEKKEEESGGPSGT